MRRWWLVSKAEIQAQLERDVQSSAHALMDAWKALQDKYPQYPGESTREYLTRVNSGANPS